MADHDPHASLVLTTRFPAVPNLGDLTHHDPTHLPAADVLTAVPPGWVTTIPSSTNRTALRLLGNAVVPTQGSTALHALLPTTHPLCEEITHVPDRDLCHRAV